MHVSAYPSLVRRIEVVIFAEYGHVFALSQQTDDDYSLPLFQFTPQVRQKLCMGGPAQKMRHVGCYSHRFKCRLLKPQTKMEVV